MFSKSFVAAIAVLAAASPFAGAKPIARRSEGESLSRRTDIDILNAPPSFNNYGGFSSMSNFDDFFGSNNFAEIINQQTIIEQQTEIVCSSVDIEIVQQRLSVLIEVAKQVIIEQICEVEVQTIVIQQFESVFSSFGGSVSRENGRQIAYDSNIAGLLGSIHNSDGSLSNNNLGFSGSDIGSNSVVVGGNNWSDETSPESVGKAKDLAKQAANYTISSNSSNSTSSD